MQSNDVFRKSAQMWAILRGQLDSFCEWVENMNSTFLILKRGKIFVHNFTTLNVIESDSMIVQDIKIKSLLSSGAAESAAIKKKLY